VNPERKTIKKTTWGPGPLGLAHPIMPYEFEIPIDEIKESTPEKDGLKTKAIDIFTGTDRAIPVVLDTLDGAHSSGEKEITDREIQRRINKQKGNLLISETGVKRALVKLTNRGQVSHRRLTAEQAVEQESNYGNNFRIAEKDSQPETIEGSLNI